MSQHLPIAETDRRLLPRGLVGRPTRVRRASFAFKVGQLVIWHQEIWLVLSRSCTSMGRQIYEIFRLGGGVRPQRLVLGDFLSPLQEPLPILLPRQQASGVA